MKTDNTFIAVVLCAGVFATGAALATVGLYDRFQETNARRHQTAAILRRLQAQDRKQHAVLRSILCFDRDSKLAEARTDNQQRSIITHYRKELRLFHAPDC